MLFIDWISPPNHRNFNRSLFSALRPQGARCVVYNSELIIPEVECILVKQEKSRLAQAIRMFMLVIKNREREILFLTYDPVFLPFVCFFKKLIVVYEHNTTPEKILSKHSIWQKLFYKKIYRLAQFPAQYEMLSCLGAKAAYVGSPLMPNGGGHKPHADYSLPFIFAAPSNRVVVDELKQFSDLLNGATILVKTGATSTNIDSPKKYKLKQLDRIEFYLADRDIDGVIITVRSRIRGSGWFNDAICHCTPILISNENARLLFEETFPEYPYIQLEKVKDRAHLENLMEEVSQFNSSNYVKLHNAQLRTRFINMCNYLNINCDLA